MVCNCKHTCYCTKLKLNKNQAILPVPREHYETFWNKLANGEEAPPIYFRGEKQKLIYHKDMNAIYYMHNKIVNNIKKKIKVRYYLIPE